MKKSQLIAIGKSYADKQARANMERAGELHIDIMYHYQTAYKTLGGYVKAYGTQRFKQAVQEAKTTLEVRRDMLDKCGCTSYKLDECLQALEQAEEYLKAW